MEERRKFTRVPISLPVESIPLPARKYFHTVSKDLSLIGMRIVLNDFMPHDKCLRVELNLINEVLHLKAKVVWCNQERMSDRYLAGLELVEVDDNSRKAIAQFLNKLQ